MQIRDFVRGAPWAPVWNDWAEAKTPTSQTEDAPRLLLQQLWDSSEPMFGPLLATLSGTFHKPSCNLLVRVPPTLSFSLQTDFGAAALRDLSVSAVCCIGMENNRGLFDFLVEIHLITEGKSGELMN